MVNVPDYVVQKLTYTYYHDGKTDDPRFMFLLEDPGVPVKQVPVEGTDYKALNQATMPDRSLNGFVAGGLPNMGYSDFARDPLNFDKGFSLVWEDHH